MHDDPTVPADETPGIQVEPSAVDTIPDDEPAVETPPPPPVPDLPVAGNERIGSLDLLRGVAVLGIFLVNIWTFGMPFPAAVNPHFPGFDQGFDPVAYVVVFMAAYTKTMPIFSMLFGAGLVLFTRRVEAREGRSGRRWFSRQAWLWAIGLVHGYMLWNGDILLPYALVGLILYKFRNFRLRTLVILAVVFVLIPKGGMWGLGEGMKYVQRNAAEASALEANGEELSEKQEQFQKIWKDNGKNWNPTSEDFDEMAAVMRGGYAGIFARNAGELLPMHLFMYPALVNWEIAGYMLIGVILFRTGVLSAGRSTRFYVRMLVLCYGIGLPGSWLAMRHLGAVFGDMVALMQSGMILVELTGVVTALGHIALIVLAFKLGWLPALQRRLAAAGRMAFTNYLSQTLIGVTLFYGYGFGLWGSVSRTGMLGISLAVWIVQLAWSPWWLARFRFGPAEWLWRSLTYRRRQPMRRAGAY